MSDGTHGEAASGPRAGALFGLGAAALFGASVPLSKLLVPDAGPLVLAGLLYLGAGLGLATLRLFRRGRVPGLRRADAKTFTGVVLAGAVTGPLLLVLGLSRASGVAASLLLNLEAPLTVLLAVALFGEHVSPRALGGIALLVLGSVPLALGGQVLASAGGVLLLAGACAAWALDNNLTARLSLRDPVALVRLKGLLGGGCTLLCGLLLGQRLPSPLQALSALAVGAVGYGVSIVWSVQAMRLLGAARQAGLFAVAPFIGALCAVPILGERLGAADLLAAALMAGGLTLLLRENHGHRHVHAPLEHEHEHVHDAHHRHAHPASLQSGAAQDDGERRHSHCHSHEALEHEHAHVSDAHHKHSH